MFDQSEAQGLVGTSLYDDSHTKVGTIGQIYLDDQTGAPEWATVATGMFGTKETFVPIQRGERLDDGVSVPFGKDQIKDAPAMEPDAGHLEQSQEAELYRYYGLDEATTTDHDVDTHATTDDVPAARTGDEDATSVVRSEEQLHVSTDRVETGRARLRKYVVTEEQTVTVPVRKEKVRLESQPLDGTETVGGLTEGDVEVTLSEERVRVEKDVVAKEKVGLATEVTEEQEVVTEQVRKEQVDVEGDVTR